MTIYGPQQFVREKGEPKTVTDEFEMPEGVIPPFRLYISNGDGNKKNQIPSTTIYVNDQLIFDGPTNKWSEDPMIFEIDLEEENTLSVRSLGQPGNFLTIWITAGVDQTPPVITISSPSEGAIFNVDEVTVTGTIVDESPTTVTVNGVDAAVTDNQAFSAVVPLTSDGEHILTATATDAAGNTAEASVTVIRDTTPPIITLLSPAEGLVTSNPILTVSGTVSDPTPTLVDVNGTSLPVDNAGNFSGEISLVEGLNELTIMATDSMGNSSSISRPVTLDTIPPILSVDSPLDGEIVGASTVVVSGTVQDATPVTVSVNGTVFATTEGGAFTGDVPLVEGSNTITIVATDAAGNTATETRTVSTSNQPPIASFTFTPTTGEAPLEVTFDASASRDPDGSIASYDWDFGDGGNGNGVSVTHTYVSANAYTVMLTVTDDGKAYGSTSLALIVSGETLPPDPVTVAPPIDRTRTTCVAEATEFLYTASNPIQTGVDPNALDCQRGAVLRGRVLTRDGTPLSGVTITILDHPEFGQTLSRADGMFDLAVSGGGALVVNYERDVYLPSQRSVNVPLQNYAWLPDVVLIPVDTRVTEIDLASPDPIQVVQGNPVSDADGNRQATLLIPQGTQAELFLPGGTTQLLTDLSVRATEYTVGENGPETMPAELPPQVGYTYALEYSVDEAMAAGARDVRFNQPLIHYVENFLDFPVGMAVPVGYYDREQAVWVPSDNGRVVKIISIADGLAELDTNGDGVADNDAALGITPDERQRLAGLYSTGQSLWRVPITHFTPWDTNWPIWPPADARSPQQEPPRPDWPIKDPCLQKHSIIECENQILRESLPIAGTPFNLHYASDRVMGRKIANSVDISLSGAAVPASLKRIDLTVEIAGRRFEQSFSAAPNQRHIFSWDGQDAYSRPLQGKSPIRIGIGYVYAGEYQAPGASGRVFGGISGVPITGSRARQELTFWQYWEGYIGAWDAQSLGLGAWSFNVQHAYDPGGKVLYLGDGERRSAENLSPVIRTVAGTGTNGNSGDGGPATAAQISAVDVSIGPDGSFYISGGSRVRRIGPDGIITTIAGGGIGGSLGDGGPATAARLNTAYSLDFGPDGSLYIADYGNRRIRRVSPDGIINTVAGTSYDNPNGSWCDNCPATEAFLYYPEYIAVGSDGSLYISDGRTRTIRRVGADGIITTVAGGGASMDCDAGCPATAARFSNPKGMDFGPDGSLYFVDDPHLPSEHGSRIWRLGLDGMITPVAGNGMQVQGSGGDGGPATEAQLGAPRHFAVGPDGSLYIADYLNHRIRRVRPDGIITTIAGNGVSSYSGDGGPATAATLSYPYDIALGRDGSLYITGWLNAGPARIRSIQPALPGASLSGFVIPAEDGEEVYIFDSQGRHLRTLGALTGTVLYQFGYNNDGTLASITDRNGLVTRVERDAANRTAAIVGPYGQRTLLSLDAQGYLAGITNPAGETTGFAYAPGGLLLGLAGPRGGAKSYTYDAEGRLTRDTDPAGSYLSAARQNDAGGYTVTLGNGLASTQYRVEPLPTGDERRAQVLPNGLQDRWLIGTNGTSTWTFSNGASQTVTQSPDPRWGMQAPVNGLIRAATPSGLTYTLQFASTAALADPLNPFSLSTLNYNASLNGRTYSGSYTAATRTFVDHSPTGRTMTTTLDALGRSVYQQLADLAPISYRYDTNGRPSAVQVGTGGESRMFQFTYNSAGTLASITDSLSRTVSFGYDAAGRVISQTGPGGQVTGYSYDAGGNLTGITPPGRPAHSIEYDPADQPTQYNPPNGNPGAGATKYSYDLSGQLAGVSLPDGQGLSISYDSAGRPSNLDSPRGTYDFTYDAATGSLAAITAPGGVGLAFTHDGPLLSSRTWSGPVTGSVGFTYNNDLRVASLSVNGGSTIAYQYDPDGMLVQAGGLSLSRSSQNGLLTGSALGSVTDAWIYNSFGEPMEYHAAYNGAALYTVQHGLDSLGRIVQKTETLGGTTDTYGYRYDVSGRLVEVTKNGASVASYSYDGQGNRLSFTGSGGTLNGSYDNQDRLLQYGSTAYTYTANGELKSKVTAGQTTTYQYDALGNMMAVMLPSGKQIAYLVDGWNRRIGKMVNGARVQGFLYQDGLRPIAELDSNNQIISRFVYASRDNVPDYLIRGGVAYRIIADPLGSPRLVVNTATGQVVQRMEYDAFGKVLSDTNPGFQPFGFAGGLYDPDTGLLRFGVRDYDPETSRWTAKDPIGFSGGDTNLYTYVENDPVNRRDPWGLFSIQVTGYGLLGAGIKVSITGRGVSFCGEVGAGVGGGVAIDPLANLDPEGGSIVAEGTVKWGVVSGTIKGQLYECGADKVVIKGCVVASCGKYTFESGERGLEMKVPTVDKNSGWRDALEKTAESAGFKAEGKIALQSCLQFNP